MNASAEHSNRRSYVRKEFGTDYVLITGANVVGYG